MAMSLGTLFVKLNADPSQLVKGMNDAADKVAKFGNKMNEVAGKLGAIGVSMTAIGAGAIRLASQFDSQVKTATDELGNSFNAIAVEIGRALVPAIRALSQGLTVVANYFRSLSPETKQMVAGFAAVTAATLTLTAGAAKIISAFTALAPVITGALSPVAGAILPIVAVIAAIIAIVPLLWAAWKSNFGNIQGFTGAVVDWIVEKWKSFKDYFSGVINFFGKAWSGLTDFLLNSWAWVMKKLAGLAAKAAKVFGSDWSNELEAFNETIDDMANRGFGGLVDDAVEGAKVMAFAWKEGASDIAGAIKDKVGAAIRGVIGEYGQGLEKLKKDAGAGAVEKAKKPVIMMPELHITGRVEEEATKIIDSTANQFNEAMGSAANRLAANMGEVGSIIQNAVQMSTIAGPWGAVASVVLDILMKTESFSKYIGKLLEVLGAIVQLLDFVLGPIFDAMTWLFDQVLVFLDWVNKVIGNYAKELVVQGTGSEIVVEDANAKLTYDGVGKLGEAAAETATTLNELNASLTNIPAGFKIAAARFNATAPSIYDFGMGANMQEIEVNLNLDGRQIHKSIVLANARGQYIHRGGVMPSKWWGA
jgi:hypothetical protein